MLHETSAYGGKAKEADEIIKTDETTCAAWWLGLMKPMKNYGCFLYGGDILYRGVFCMAVIFCIGVFFCMAVIFCITHLGVFFLYQPIYE